jgi:hypothetical protein
MASALEWGVLSGTPLLTPANLLTNDTNYHRVILVIKDRDSKGSALFCIFRSIVISFQG